MKNFIVFDFIKFFKGKSLLIIHDNGLGDYFLVRNYFKYIKQSEKYKNYKIVYLAKKDRIDCVKKYDKKYIDKIIKFSPERFENKEKYRTKILKKLNRENITDIVNIGIAFPLIDNEPYSTITICDYFKNAYKTAHIIEPENEELKNKYSFIIE